MSTRILLARHGIHDEVGVALSGRSEIALNVAGRAQAAALAEQLAGVPIRKICSSPRRRCEETAAPVAARLRLPVLRAAALDEIDFGAFTGRSFAALAPDPTWRHWNEARGEARCPDGETMAEATARARAYVLSLGEVDGPVLCVTHCDMIRGLACDALGIGYDRLLALPCDPGSLTLLDVEHGSLRLVALNLRPGQPVDQ